MKNKYYVYKVFLGEDVIYVGKGQGTRSNHVLSGKSHNAKLNEYYYKHTLLGETSPVVKKVKYFSEESLALKYESYLIKDLLPACNVRGTKTSSTVSKGTPKSTNKRSTEKISVEEDFILDLPDTYEEFFAYMENLHKEYLGNSTSKTPQPLKWFCYGKKVSKVWSPYVRFLDRMFVELDIEDKENPTKTGRKEGFPILLGFTVQEKNAFYRMQRKRGSLLDVNNEDDFKEAEDWLKECRVKLAIKNSKKKGKL